MPATVPRPHPTMRVLACESGVLFTGPCPESEVADRFAAIVRHRAAYCRAHPGTLPRWVKRRAYPGDEVYDPLTKNTHTVSAEECEEATTR